MSTITDDAGQLPGRATLDTVPVDARVPGPGAALRSQWLSFATLRTNWYVLGAAAVVMVLVGTVAAAAVGSDAPAPGGPSFASGDPLQTVLTGANFSVLLVGVLGCLVGAREHGSRMVVTTFVATPHRGRVLLARAVVLAGVVVPTSLVATVGAFLAGNAVLDARGEPSLTLSSDGVLGQLLGMTGWLTAVALLGMGLGLLTRTIASSVGALMAVVLIAPPIVGALLPDSADEVLQVLPSNAAAAITTVQASGDITIDGATGSAILVAWVVVVLGLAARSVVRRDV
ncbi:hypothetical protein [Nocardioides okcheonensis]|uniref:hypothetical protein n=1 Tax=Nocardioides okcheonensis TaxID=2894081 RepID=UPI001E5548FC|nr:hypothetical protein [Nocardioides okcheonensis]UFN42605.1 hypothetical protein LN652_11060 [Nocardioides okcheonensis]